MIQFWHLIVHLFGVDAGLPYGQFGFYDFWSGVAGSFLVAVIVWWAGFYRHRTCHYAWWCQRWAHVDLAGGLGRVCHRHAPHPELAGQRRPRGKRLHELHAAWEIRQRAHHHATGGGN